MRRLLNDRRYFAKPTKALFTELRSHFPINEQLFDFQVVDRNVKMAIRYLDEVPPEELYEKLRPFKDKVAEDIKEGES